MIVCNNRDTVIVRPQNPSGYEPFHVLLYEDIHFVTPHYQSLRMRQTAATSSTSTSNTDASVLVHRPRGQLDSITDSDLSFPLM